MTAPEIQRLYPNAPDAVELHERGIMADTLWRDVRTLGGDLPVQEIVDRLILCATMSVIACGAGIVSQALPQMHHPDFARYVAAKLGRN